MKNRKICTKWIMKLCELTSNDPVVKKNRNHFFKYMLIVLHRDISEHDDPQFGYPQIKAKHQLKESMGGKSFMSRWSADKRTYVAVKPIAGSGALVYMAVSKDPSLGWEYSSRPPKSK